MRNYNLLDRERIDWAWPDTEHTYDGKPKIGSSVCDESKFILKFFKGKENGFAIDIGAADGITHNNTFELFNKPYYWDGLSIEANPRFNKQRKTLFKDTNVSVYCGAVSDIDGEINMKVYAGDRCGHSQVGKGDTIIKSMKINSLLEKYEVPNYIDFISMDIEGAEPSVLNNWDWGTYKVKLWCIENASKYIDLFEKNGYECLNPNQKDFDEYKICHNNTFFVNKNI